MNTLSLRSSLLILEEIMEMDILFKEEVDVRRVE